MTTIDLSDPQPTRTWWRSLLFWTGGVVVYATVLAAQAHLPWDIALRSAALYVYSLALLMIPVRTWALRWLPPALPTGPLLLRHAAVGLTTITVWLGINLLQDRLTVGPMFWDYIYKENWMFQLLFATTIYGMVMGFTLTSQAWTREREREQRESELLIVARDAELGAIRAQFQPHFVLNALNSLLALIDKDPAVARTMVVRLADVMKAVFDRVDVAAVPLDRELDLVRAYLDVEQIRFGQRLTVEIDVDVEARATMVPPLLLQPIVENAVKHGIAPHAHAGTVRIAAHVVGGRLEIIVRDSGTGASEVLGTGQGLLLTRRRLQTVYGSNYQMGMTHASDGTSVRIVVPAGVSDAE